MSDQRKDAKMANFGYRDPDVFAIDYAEIELRALAALMALPKKLGSTQESVMLDALMIDEERAAALLDEFYAAYPAAMETTTMPRSDIQDAVRASIAARGSADTDPKSKRLLESLGKIRSVAQTSTVPEEVRNALNRTGAESLRQIARNLGVKRGEALSMSKTALIERIYQLREQEEIEYTWKYLSALTVLDLRHIAVQKLGFCMQDLYNVRKRELISMMEARAKKSVSSDALQHEVTERMRLTTTGRRVDDAAVLNQIAREQELSMRKHDLKGLAKKKKKIDELLPAAPQRSVEDLLAREYSALGARGRFHLLGQRLVEAGVLKSHVGDVEFVDGGRQRMPDVTKLEPGTLFEAFDDGVLCVGFTLPAMHSDKNGDHAFAVTSFIYDGEALHVSSRHPTSVVPLSILHGEDFARLERLCLKQVSSASFANGGINIRLATKAEWADRDIKGVERSERSAPARDRGPCGHDLTSWVQAPYMGGTRTPRA